MSSSSHAQHGFDMMALSKGENKGYQEAKNVSVSLIIRNICVLCWFLLAAVCLQMSDKLSEGGVLCENSKFIGCFV